MSFWTKLRDTVTGKAFLDSILPKEQDLGAQFDKQLQAQRESAKLQAANEATNVAQFDGQDPELSVGTDMRRKKKPAGSYATSLGLNV